MSHDVVTQDGIVRCFFGRRGGVSAGLYDSLNCGLGTEDDPDAVRENRRRAAEALNAQPENLVTLYQIHSADCLTLSAPPMPGVERPRGDALVTRQPGLVLGILTADCAPVLFHGRDAGGHSVIGAAHAGWKGAIGGVVAGTVAAMRELGVRPETLKAAIGPCIAQSSYEVSADFMASFLEQDAGASSFFLPGASADKRQFDLPGYVLGRCRAAGVGDVFVSGTDTYAAEGGYFSYRRTTHRREPDYGRQLSAIMIPPG